MALLLWIGWKLVERKIIFTLKVLIKRYSLWREAAKSISTCCCACTRKKLTKIRHIEPINKVKKLTKKYRIE